ncbi:MAG: hypothetical protein JWQ97_3629 [Phenylobacterium sp.]|nr:hypothetical protein [Phenylobacterium sp.]
MSLPDYVLKGKLRRALGIFVSITTLGVNAESVANALTASTTQTRVGGLALTKAINRVSTAVTSGDAVTLAALTPGQSQVVINDGASPIKVFPNGASDQIDGGTAGASVTLTNAKRCRFTCLATNVIVSQLMPVSA